MRLRRQLLGRALIFVVLLGGVSHAADLRPLLGVWEFYVTIIIDKEKKEVKNIIFVDDIYTKNNESLATGISLSGFPLIAAEGPSNPLIPSPYQYYIAWEDPPGEGLWFTYEFNFITPNTVTGVFSAVHADKGKMKPVGTIGFRVCKERATCKYQ